jgi:hypothetical protein
VTRILVIDDDRQIGALAVELLKAEGYQADSAADGISGLSRPRSRDTGKRRSRMHGFPVQTSGRTVRRVNRMSLHLYASTPGLAPLRRAPPANHRNDFGASASSTASGSHRPRRSLRLPPGGAAGGRGWGGARADRTLSRPRPPQNRRHVRRQAPGSPRMLIKGCYRFF